MSYFDLWVVWGDAEADQAVRHGQRLVHVDAGGRQPRLHAVRSVEACGAGADDRNVQRRILSTTTTTAVAGDGGRLRAPVPVPPGEGEGGEDGEGCICRAGKVEVGWAGQAWHGMVCPLGTCFGEGGVGGVGLWVASDKYKIMFGPWNYSDSSVTGFRFQ